MPTSTDNWVVVRHPETLADVKIHPLEKRTVRMYLRHGWVLVEGSLWCGYIHPEVPGIVCRQEFNHEGPHSVEVAE